MATVAHFAVAGGSFPLGRIVRSLPDATAEIERIIPTDDTIVPYVWISGIPAADVVAAFENRSAVREVEVIDRFADRVLIRAEWDGEVHGIKRGIVDSGLTLLSAQGSREEWTFELRGTSRAAIGRFRSYCEERGIGVRLRRIGTLADAAQATGFGLTDRQRDALRLAFERGYFDTPRRCHLADLAAELGISRPSVADRLRRGQRRLIGNTIGPTPE